MQKILSEVHQKFVDTRRLQALVSSDRFSEAYSRSTEKEKEELDKIIESCKPVALTDWITAKLSEYEDMNKSDLRREAMIKRVKYYSRKSKDELIQILKELDIEKGSTNTTDRGKAESNGDGT